MGWVAVCVKGLALAYQAGRFHPAYQPVIHIDQIARIGEEDLLNRQSSSACATLYIFTNKCALNEKNPDHQPGRECLIRHPHPP